MRLMQREPFLRLLVRLVMEFVIDASRTKRGHEFALNIFGKLALVDKNIRAGHRSTSEQHPAREIQQVRYAARPLCTYENACCTSSVPFFRLSLSLMYSRYASTVRMLRRSSSAICRVP